MKKFVSVCLTAAMLCALTGCSDPDHVAETPDSDSKTISTELTEAVQTELTEAVQTTETTKAALPESSSLSQALAIKMANWDQGNVNISACVEQDGQEVSVIGCQLGNQFAFDMKVSNYMENKFIFDGSKLYMIHDKTKQYAEIEPDAEDVSQDYKAYFLDVAKTADPIATGTETIDGKTYTFEEFETEDGSICYYFNDAEEICYMRDTESNDIHIPLTIEFMTTKDTAAFSLPDGYQSTSKEEMLGLIMSDMFMMLGDALGEIDADGNTSFSFDSNENEWNIDSDFTFSFSTEDE